jgi:hypothetical protein
MIKGAHFPAAASHPLIALKLVLFLLCFLFLSRLVGNLGKILGFMIVGNVTWVRLISQWMV